MGASLQPRVICVACLMTLGFSLFAPGASAAALPGQCRQLVIRGQVNAGDEWNEPIGENWVFRLVPIKPEDKGYSGWDLVVDRTGGTGFPDALLLATPPYDSINQREVGTTFGLRAQDAIGWNPRSFRFLTDPAEFQAAKKLYFTLHSAQQAGQRGGKGIRPAPEAKSAESFNAASKLLTKIAVHSSAGQFRMLDAQIMPGTADALPFARSWALQQRNTPHTVKEATPPTPRGKLDAVRFEITLWLPAGWRLPKNAKTVPSPCQ